MPKQSLLLFAKASVDRGLADPAQLCAVLSNDELTATWAYLDDLLFDLSSDKPALYDNRNQRPIQEYNNVWFRYWAAQEGQAIAAAHICKQLNVPFIDVETVQVGSRNKLSQYVLLHEAGISIPRTLMATTLILKQHYTAADFNFPFIMKDKSGSRGQGNYLVRSEAEMDQIESDISGRTFILQEFIPNDGDYRIVVVGSEARLAIHRRASGDSHLNNLSQGGQAELVPLNTLPAKLLEMSVKAAAIFGRDVAGVDMVQSQADGQYYCFEVNRAPQIENAAFETEKADILRDYLSSL